MALDFLNHPSLRLAADMHLMWLSLMRMPRARQTVAFRQAVTALINAYWPKLVRPETVDGNEGTK